MGSFFSLIRDCAVFFGCTAGVAAISARAFSRFFSDHLGWRSCLLIFFLFLFIIYIALKIIQEKKPQCLRDFFVTVAGARVGGFLYLLLVSALYSLLGCLASAFASYAAEPMGLPEWPLRLSFFSIIYIVLLCGKRGVHTVFLVMSPLLAWGGLSAAGSHKAVISASQSSPAFFTADAFLFCGTLAAVLICYLITLGPASTGKATPLSICAAMCALAGKSVVRVVLISSAVSVFIPASRPTGDGGVYPLIMSAACLMTGLICASVLCCSAGQSSRRGMAAVMLSAWVFVAFDASFLLRTAFILCGAAGLATAVASAGYCLRFINHNKGS